MDARDWSMCPACGNGRGAEYIVLHAEDNPFRPHVRVASACAACWHERDLLHSYPLGPTDVVGQLRALARFIEQTSGVPVIADDPGDPLTGVREPRRPLPGAGTAGVALDLPFFDDEHLTA